MIKIVDNRILAELLNDDGMLSEKVIKGYDYIEFKNDFEEIVDILSTKNGQILAWNLYIKT